MSSSILVASTAPNGVSVQRSKHGRLRLAFKQISLVLMIVAVWGLTHNYAGINLDAIVYALQALARIHTSLSVDLFLQNTSQEQFTLFSPLYACFVETIGLDRAALVLTTLFAVLSLSGAWWLIRSLISTDVAWLATAFLAGTVGYYGGYEMFHVNEEFLTARLPAESLIVVALACHVQDLKISGFLLAICAVFVHPLLALPGLLVLTLLWMPSRLGVLSLILGVVATLGVAIAALYIPGVDRYITPMDSDWLRIVQHRSEFLFLQYWRLQDWEINARSFVCLTLTTSVFVDAQIRKVCFSALWVGIAGLSIFAIASKIGAVAALIQGQAWRWIWPTTFLSVLFVPPTILKIWRNDKCGAICATFLLLSWTFKPISGLACALLALSIWTLRTKITDQAARYFRWLAIAIWTIVTLWFLGNAYTSISTQFADGSSPVFLQQFKNITALQIPLVAIVWVFWFWVSRNRMWFLPVIATCVIAVSLPAILTTSFKHVRPLSLGAFTEDFDDWRNLIPPTSTVFVVNNDPLGWFVWFTLLRPNYLSSPQSAGLVYSRPTAIEVLRRSNFMLPIFGQQWMRMTPAMNSVKANEKADTPEILLLTADRLKQACADPKLGFVIAKEDVGYSPRKHLGRGSWENWNLYDCAYVRQMSVRNGAHS